MNIKAGQNRNKFVIGFIVFIFVAISLLVYLLNSQKSQKIIKIKAAGNPVYRLVPPVNLARNAAATFLVTIDTQGAR
jgi:hypothetical protein